MSKPYSFDQSKAIWAEAKKLIAGGSQGTRCPEYPDFPTYFTRAKGCRMWDVDGNEFIDLLCSIGPIILGYAYDRVEQYVDEIRRDSFQSSMNHPVQLELARLLVDLIPSAERVRFLKTGTEATQAAVRLARHVTGRLWVARHGLAHAMRSTSRAHGWARVETSSLLAASRPRDVVSHLRVLVCTYDYDTMIVTQSLDKALSMYTVNSQSLLRLIYQSPCTFFICF